MHECIPVMKTCVAGAAAPISPLGSQLAYSIGILCSEGQDLMVSGEVNNRQQVIVLRQLTPALQSNYHSVPPPHDTQ
jgi:hypothetical protein